MKKYMELNQGRFTNLSYLFFEVRKWFIRLLQTLLSLSVMFIVLSCDNGTANNVRANNSPNIIVILTDDQGYVDLGSYDSKTIKTPNIDNLAADGIRFTDFYTHPICSPSRAALMTGCYAPRTGFADVQLWGSPYGLNPDEVTIAEVLKGRGYRTGVIGKWHLGEENIFAPNQQGFDYFYGIRLVNGTQKFENFAVPLFRNDSLITNRPNHSQFTKDFTSEALSFIDHSEEKPFFLYLAYTAPHAPIYPGEGFRGTSGVSLYADAVEEIDWSVGQLVGKLKEKGLEENTLIIYTSDNGPWLGLGDQSGSAGPLRGGKMSTWEGGVRVPCIMRWKNVIPSGKVCHEIAGIIDLAPTIASVANAEMPNDRIIDGKNLLPLISGEEYTPPHEDYLFFAGTWLQGIRSGKWKLVFARPEMKRGIYGECASWFTSTAEILPENLLFDLEIDVGETKNLAKEYPEIVKNLSLLAEKAKEDIGDYGKKGKNSRPIGSTYPELTDISKYPQSPHAKAASEKMITEMRTFQKKRFGYLIMRDSSTLNGQEAEELKFYRQSSF